ncbi:hypothetical protein PENVUL_c028G08638 [Penicillium vulpinum]|uniref:Uncharacterized protein n=1 Tax=Penicillium vulpinum TaxID=29845 RepID=A0A1V6RU28_9EURO|nr:hypothetical protein PENVUL_c028G08638 [Penicillium vulpinum]
MGESWNTISPGDDGRIFLSLIKVAKVLVKVYEWAQVSEYSANLLTQALELDGKIHCWILNARWVLFCRIDMLQTERDVSGDGGFMVDLACRGYKSASCMIQLVQSLPSESIPGGWIFDSYSTFTFFVLFIGVVNHPLSLAANEHLSVMSSVIENTALNAFSELLISNRHLTQFMTLYCRVARLLKRRAEGTKSQSNQSRF